MIRTLLFLLFSISAIACPEHIQKDLELKCNTKYTREVLELQIDELLDLEYFSKVSSSSYRVLVIWHGHYWLTESVQLRMTFI